MSANTVARIQTPPPPPPALPVLRRLVTPWPERKTVHVPADRWRSEPLAALLARAEELHVRTLVLVAGPYAHKAQRPPREWWLAPAAAGWAIHNYLGDPPRATYRRACAVGESGERTITVDVVTSAPWFGEAMDADTVRHAWRQLQRLCRGSFDSFATLFSTPARTGLDLMQRTLPKGAEYPVAPADILRLLHDNSGQGRMQFLPTAADTSNLYWLDARWQYAGCVSNLPRGPLHMDRRPDYIPHVPAFYLARWKCPADWPYAFGLLPELTGETEDDGPRFHYPIDAAHWHTGWVTGVELELAREQGWDVRISERTWWGMTGADPLRNGHTGWSDTLRTMREHTHNPLVNAAVRHLLIDTVGAWHRQARRELHITPIAEAERTIPAGRAYGLVVRGDVVEWYSDGALPEALQLFQHPEWAWTVWGRSRVHTLRAALRYLEECPGGEVAAFRSDCIVVTRDPGWIDNQKIGTFRRKRQLEHVPVPRDEPAYRALLALDDATAAELDDELTDALTAEVA